MKIIYRTKSFDYPA